MEGLSEHIYTDTGIIGLVLFAGLVTCSGVILALWKWGNNHANRHEESLKRFIEISEHAATGLQASARESAAQREQGQRIETKIDTLLQEQNRIARDIDRVAFGNQGRNRSSSGHGQDRT